MGILSPVHTHIFLTWSTRNLSAGPKQELQRISHFKTVILINPVYKVIVSATHFSFILKTINISKQKSNCTLSLKHTGIAETTLIIAGCLSPPEWPTQTTAHLLTVPAHCSLRRVAHVQRGTKLRSAPPLHVTAASSCRPVHAKCRTWLLLHHSEHQALQPSHYFGPWRSYSYVYGNLQPAGTAVDIAKDSSTPLKAGLLTGSAEPLHHPKHRDVLEWAWFSQRSYRTWSLVLLASSLTSAVFLWYVTQTLTPHSSTVCIIF